MKLPGHAEFPRYQAGWLDISLLANRCRWVEFGEEGVTEESFCLRFIEMLDVLATAIYGKGLPAQTVVAALLDGEGFVGEVFIHREVWHSVFGIAFIEGFTLPLKRGAGGRRAWVG